MGRGGDLECNYLSHWMAQRMIIDTKPTIDDLPPGVLRGPAPRVYRDRWWDTATLITRQAHRRREFIKALPDGPEEVFEVTHSGRDLWLVRAPLRDAERALRRLGWAEQASARDPAEDCAPETRGHRRLCGAWGRRARRR